VMKAQWGAKALMDCIPCQRRDAPKLPRIAAA
jgi:hypothetical protein